jgi:hypothetical protein
MTNPTNLTQKLDEIQTQIATQHTEVIAVLNSIAAGLGSPPPASSTTTLADVASILSAIHADTMSQDQKLQRIRDAIAPLDELLPVEDRSAMAWSVYRLADAVAPPWPRPVSAPVQPRLELLWRLLELVVGVDADAPHSILYLLNQFNTNFGSNIQGLTATELLWAIAQQTNVIAGPALPEQISTQQCANPYKSTRMDQGLNASTSANYTSRNFASWYGGVPAGLTQTQLQSGVPQGAELSPVTNTTWSGWQIFVYSVEAAVFKENPSMAGGVLLPTNKWLEVGTARGATRPIAPNVDSASDLLIYLCPSGSFTGQTPPGQVAGIISGAGLVVKVNTYNSTRMVAQWPVGIGQETFTMSDATQYSNLENARVFLPGNYQNWTARHVSGGSSRVYPNANSVSTPVALVAIGGATKIQQQTEMLIARSDGDVPFALELIPPV